MTRLAFAVAAAVLTSALASTSAEAANKGSKSSSSSSGSKTVQLQKTVSKTPQHSQTLVLRHLHYRGWTQFCWYPRFGCYCCYCPTACEWFYYYQPSACYLPISQVAQFPPTTVNVNVNNNNNQNVGGGSTPPGGTPVLPEGATPLPGGVTPPLPGLTTTPTPPMPGADDQ
jgi:hypothetical protein